MKGLTVSVFRNAEFGVAVHELFSGDSTNGGLSATHNQFVLIGEGIPGVFEPDEKHPALVLVKRNLGGAPYLHAEPLEKPPGMVGPMFGGNFVYTSDSRFPNSYPIPIHDRFETPAEYERMSR